MLLSLLFVFALADSPPDISRDPFGWFIYWLQKIADSVMDSISRGAGSIGDSFVDGVVSTFQGMFGSISSGWQYANIWLGETIPWLAPVAPVVIGGLIIIVAIVMVKIIMMLL